MSAWTPEQWITFLTGLGGFLAALSTIYLQIRGNAKTEAAKVISADNNVKLNAVVSQTHELARADPVASTAPTDALVQAATDSIVKGQ